MKIGVVVFPGSNCDRDCGRAVQKVTGTQPEYLWHKDTDLKNCEVVILPGGFSYGDYLRCGSIARYSPIMQSVVDAAGKGLPILGICNGFQILTECGLLPGVLMRNRDLKFICRTVSVRLENNTTAFTKSGQLKKSYRIPIAHMEGNYFLEDTELEKLEEAGQVVFRYVDEKGEATEAANPNGAQHNIAGVCNGKGNVLGLMPHPERVCEDLLGGTDGRFMFEGLM